MNVHRNALHAPPSAPEGLGPPVEFWLPFSARCDSPGRYPCPGSNAVLVICETA